MTSFKVSTFLFDANKDQKFILVTYHFPEPIYARIIRITCLSRDGDKWQMRFEILGCKQK